MIIKNVKLVDQDGRGKLDEPDIGWYLAFIFIEHLYLDLKYSM